MKEKNNSVQAKRNRNNRKRGASFEKRVAEILDMFVVPYSGSNARFGYGDVRDTEGKGGVWLGECKNITSDDKLTIKREWIDKNKERAKLYDAMSFIAFMKSGSTDKFIMIDQDGISAMEGNGYWHGASEILLPRANKNAVNMIIGVDTLKIIKTLNGAFIKMDGYDEMYYIMPIETFKNLIEVNKLHAKFKE